MTPRPRFDKLAEDKRATILRAAASEFAAVPPVEDASAFWAEMESLAARSMELWAARPELAGLLFAAEELLRGGHWDEDTEAALVGEGVNWFDRIYDLGQSVGAVRTDLPDDLLKSLLWAVGEAQNMWFARHSSSTTRGALNVAITDLSGEGLA
jgi:hypothetical protein